MSAKARVEARIAREKQIVKDLVAYLAKHEYHIVGIDNGEDETEVSKIDDVIKEAFATDEAWLKFENDENDLGYVFIVLGNDEDLISDWTWKVGSEFPKVMDEFTKEK
jgi:hypothetical protein